MYNIAFSLDSDNAVTLKWQLYSSNNAEELIEILKELILYIWNVISFFKLNIYS